MGVVVCLACGSWSGHPVCPSCAATLAGAPAVRLSAGLVVRPAFRHGGAARRLVHRLKYQACRGAALPLAAAMVARLPAGIGCLVPVPRARLRHWRHGVDPAAELAEALHRLTGLPVARALRAPWWWRPHAGRSRSERGAPAFAAVALPPAVALVDDVLTTGATLAAAASALGGTVLGAVTATAATPGAASFTSLRDRAGRVPGGAKDSAVAEPETPVNRVPR